MATVEQPSTTPTAAAHPGRDHLLFLDGMRGAAALAVVFLHAFLFTGQAGQTTDTFPEPVASLFIFGHYGVAVFIVLSGFVLALPVARSAETRLRGSTLEYFKRRARRILPPYYAALAVFIVLIAVIPGLDQRSGTAWDSKIPVEARDVATHALLVHNLDGAGAYKIDGPMWSVATEWQLYFLLPLLLIPLWRRLGPLPTALAALALGLVAFQVFDRVEQARSWYLGLFAFGAAAAFVVAGRVTIPPRVPWKPILVGCAALAVLLHVVDRDWAESHQWVIEPLLGAAVAGAIVHLAASPSSGVRRVFASPVAVKLGLFSYSIYLVHSPLLGWFNLATRDVDVPLGVRFAAMCLVAVPLAVGVSYGFYLLVERRFLSGHQKAVKT